MAILRVVTDSTADIPADVRKSLKIEMVPLKVHFGNDTYLDGVTLQSDEFYDKLKNAPQLPTTSQPSPVEFVEVYKKLLDDDPEAEVISIHLSSAFSGTYQSALLAKSLLEDPDRVTVVDSKSISYGIGMLAVAAAKGAEEGLSKQEILDRIAALRHETKIYIMVDTLEYLYKGGRIGKASALFGSLLNIKPILSIDENGEVAPLDKVRGQKKALARILELMQEDFGDRPIHLGIAYVQLREASDELGRLVNERFDVRSVLPVDIGPVVGTHIGPGTAAVFITPAP